MSSGDANDVIVASVTAAWDITVPAAATFVAAVRDVMKTERRKAAVGEMLTGVGLIVVGGVITGGTYLLTGPGGVFLVTWGLVAWGVIKTCMGLIKLSEA